jgi:hypothetical protein
MRNRLLGVAVIVFVLGVICGGLLRPPVTRAQVFPTVRVKELTSGVGTMLTGITRTPQVVGFSCTQGSSGEARCFLAVVE